MLYPSRNQVTPETPGPPGFTKITGFELASAFLIIAIGKNSSLGLSQSSGAPTVAHSNPSSQSVQVTAWVRTSSMLLMGAAVFAAGVQPVRNNTLATTRDLSRIVSPKNQLCAERFKNH